MITLQEINNCIIAKGNQLANDAQKAISDITLNGKEITSLKQSKDVPSRPWLLTGGACLVIGIGGVLSSYSKNGNLSCDKWPYYVGALGLLALGVGLKKIYKNDNNEKSYSSNLNIDDEKAFIIEKCNKILDKTKNDWDKFMDSLKSDVQSMIKSSSILEERKDEFLSLTYYPETLSLSTLNLIDKFDTVISDSNFASQIMLEKAKFANEVALSIKEAVNKQIDIYNKIII